MSFDLDIFMYISTSHDDCYHIACLCTKTTAVSHFHQKSCTWMEIISENAFSSCRHPISHISLHLAFQQLEHPSHQGPSAFDAPGRTSQQILATRRMWTGQRRDIFSFFYAVCMLIVYSKGQKDRLEAGEVELLLRSMFLLALQPNLSRWERQMLTAVLLLSGAEALLVLVPRWSHAPRFTLRYRCPFATQRPRSPLSSEHSRLQSPPSHRTNARCRIVFRTPMWLAYWWMGIPMGLIQRCMVALCFVHEVVEVATAHDSIDFLLSFVRL